MRKVAPQSSVRFIALVVALAAILAARAYLRINLTDSLPRGLYLATRVPEAGVDRGQLVVVCPPRAYADFGRTRGYLLVGGCPGGVAPLLKVVAARAGDVVSLSQSGLAVNGTLLPHTALIAKRRGEQSPAHVPFATYRIATGDIWLFTPKDNGYDSRYFGAVRTSSVLSVAVPLLTR